MSQQFQTPGGAQSVEPFPQRGVGSGQFGQPHLVSGLNGLSGSTLVKTSRHRPLQHCASDANFVIVEPRESQRTDEESW
jgi:hypothetical protein